MPGTCHSSAPYFPDDCQRASSLHPDFFEIHSQGNVDTNGERVLLRRRLAGELQGPRGSVKEACLHGTGTKCPITSSATSTRRTPVLQQAICHKTQARPLARRPHCTAAQSLDHVSSPSENSRPAPRKAPPSILLLLDVQVRVQGWHAQHRAQTPQRRG